MGGRGRTTFLAVLASLLLVIPMGTASAAIIAVTNPSFEFPDVADGAGSNTITDWTVESGVGGVLDPVDTMFTGTTGNPGGILPDGTQVAFASGGTLTQLTSSTFLGGSAGRYVLTVEIGNRKDLGFSSTGGKIALFADVSTSILGEIAFGSGFVDPDLFKTLTLTLNTADIAAAFIGDTIGILLFGSDGAGLAQSAFDSVALEFVPLPAALPLLLTALGALGLFWRRRQRAQEG